MSHVRCVRGRLSAWLARSNTPSIGGASIANEWFGGNGIIARKEKILSGIQRLAFIYLFIFKQHATLI